MPANQVQLCESLSAYKHVYPAHHEKYDQNPSSYSHYLFRLGASRLSILSRVASYGLDYSGRTNKLAHSVVVQPDERFGCGPAAIMAEPSFFLTEWQGEARYLEREKQVPVSGDLPFAAPTWERITGDPGWAGALAEHARKGSTAPVYVVYPPELTQDDGLLVLRLMAEALVWLPPRRRWNVTFSTCFWSLPTGSDCVWRCCLPDSEALLVAGRTPEALVLDLTEGLGACPGGEFVVCARERRQPDWPDEPSARSTRDAQRLPPRHAAKSRLERAKDAAPRVVPGWPGELQPAASGGLRQKIGRTLVVVLLVCCAFLLACVMQRVFAQRAAAEAEMRAAAAEDRAIEAIRERNRREKMAKWRLGTFGQVGQGREDAENPAAASAQPSPQPPAVAPQDQVRADEDRESDRTETPGSGTDTTLLAIPGTRGVIPLKSLRGRMLPSGAAAPVVQSLTEAELSFGVAGVEHSVEPTAEQRENRVTFNPFKRSCFRYDLSALCGQIVYKFPDGLELARAGAGTGVLDCIRITGLEGHPDVLIWLADVKLTGIGQLLAAAPLTEASPVGERQLALTWRAKSGALTNALERGFRRHVTGARLVQLLGELDTYASVTYREEYPYAVTSSYGEALPVQWVGQGRDLRLVTKDGVRQQFDDFRAGLRDKIRTGLEATWRTLCEARGVEALEKEFATAIEEHAQLGDGPRVVAAIREAIETYRDEVRELAAEVKTAAADAAGMQLVARLEEKRAQRQELVFTAFGAIHDGPVQAVAAVTGIRCGKGSRTSLVTGAD